MHSWDSPTGRYLKIEVPHYLTSEVPMTHMESLIRLIDEAAKIAGSANKLSKQIGVPQQRIADWKSGRRTATPEDQALLAAIAGYDPIQTLARATVEKWEGKAKGDRLMQVLGKALLATGGAIGSAGASAAAIFSSTPIAHESFTRAIQSILGRIRRTQLTLCQVF